MYSLGVILYKILYNLENQNIRDFNFDSNPFISTEMKELIKKMV